MIWPWLLVAGVAVVGIRCIVKALSLQPLQCEVRDRRRCATRIEREETILGNCKSCEGIVNSTNGEHLHDRHVIHHTCAHVFKSSLDKLQKLGCEICLLSLVRKIDAAPNNGLRRRNTTNVECVNCAEIITENNERKLLSPCNHAVHESCWKRMKEASMTTCPACPTQV